MSTIELVIDRPADRDAVRELLPDRYDVETGDGVGDSDLYLVDERAFPKYHDSLQERVQESHPTFCPVVLIRRPSPSLDVNLPDPGEQEPPLLVDGVLEAPLTRAPVLRRVDSLLARREQSVQRQQDVRRLERYEQIVEASGDAIYALDTEGRIQMVNDSHVEWSGYSREELVGSHVSTFMPDEDVRKGTELIKDILADPDKKRGRFEMRARRPDGEVRTYEDNVAVITDEDGEFVGSVGVIRDITERKERERELQEEKAFIDGILNSLSDVFYAFDGEGNLIEYNDRLPEVTGYDPDELEEMAPWDFFPEDEREEIMDKVGTVIETEQKERLEAHYLTSSGETLPYEFSGAPFYDGKGNVAGFVGTGRDISQRKKRDRELRRQKTFLEHSPVAVAVLDETGEIVYQSPASERVVGLSADELLGDGAFEYVHPDDRDDVVKTFTSLIGEPGGRRTAEYRLGDGDGNWQWMRSTAINHLQDDAIGGIVIASVDITERKEFEQRLETQRDNLEVLNQVLRHDIRNDLQLVLTYAETLDHKLEAQREHVDEILNGAQSAIELTRDAKEVADVMLGVQAELEQFDVRQVLTEELTDVRDSYENALITTEGTIPSAEVLADEMIGSVFRNLITNAIEHNDKERPEVTLSAGVEGGHVRVCVADNGPGIPDERKAGIFEEGKKGIDSSGTGLGLHLVQTLVTRYGGDVWVEDNEPEGTEFTVELPTARPHSDD